MRKIKAALALVLLLALALAATGCGAQSLIIGSWVDDTQSLTMQLGKDGQAIVTAYNFPLEVTYTYEGDVLTILYSEDITDTGTVTFYGDNEFVWEKTDEDGELYWETYTRQGCRAGTESGAKDCKATLRPAFRAPGGKAPAAALRLCAACG